MRQFIFQLQYSLVCDCTDGVLREHGPGTQTGEVVSGESNYQTLSGIWSCEEDDTHIALHFYCVLCLKFL